MNRFIILSTLVIAILIALLARTATVESIPVSRSIDIIEPATCIGGEVLVASCSDGTLLCYDYRGNKRWETTLSGQGNQVIDCIDIDNNGDDEVMAVSNNGSVYCLNSNGEIAWVYSSQDTPLTALCTVEIEGMPYIVCCGKSNELHYLSTSGEWLGTIPILQEGDNALTANNLKSIKLSSGNQVIALLNKEYSKAHLHLFRPLAKEPYKSISLPQNTPIASATVSYQEGSKPTLLLGAYTNSQQVAITKIDIESGEVTTVAMPLTITDNEQLADHSNVKWVEMESKEHPLLLGSKVFLSAYGNYEQLYNKQQYTDLFYNPNNSKLVLTSTTASGENYIDIVSTHKRAWRESLTTHRQ